MSTPFADRQEAGKLLASKLTNYKDKPNTIILSLVRGGVAVGRALADELHLPLFPYIARKIGFPDHREFAIGALAEGGATYMDEATMKRYDLPWSDIEPIIEEEMEELKRRKEKYMIKPRSDLKDKVIILTDDGIATGSTMFAAIEDLRNAEVKKIVVAIPVGPPDTVRGLERFADETIVLSTPANFSAVGQWYKEFAQVEDEEVIELLKNDH